jgi:5-methylcytosine-specific restriction endonuclease McrA
MDPINLTSLAAALLKCCGKDIRNRKEYLERQRWRLYEEQDRICGYCHLPVHRIWGWTVDHKIPTSRGGSDLAENLIGACKGCNSEKADMTDIEFRFVLEIKESQHHESGKFCNALHISDIGDYAITPTFGS